MDFTELAKYLRLLWEHNPVALALMALGHKRRHRRPPPHR
jgi:hypothetical protein